MSHFAVIVASKTAADVEHLLAPFKEDLELPRYLARTKAQIIADARKEIEDYATTGCYRAFIADPETYIQKIFDRKNGASAGHLAYLAVEFPKKLTWTDDEVYADASRWIEAEDLDEDGNEWSTSNPNAKWDYWRVGGRWAGRLHLKPGATGHLEPLSWEWDHGDRDERPSPTLHADQAMKRDVDLDATQEAGASYAVLLPDGEWIARGEMGWFGFSRDDVEADWPALWRKALDSIPDDHLLTVTDCHI